MKNPLTKTFDFIKSAFPRKTRWLTDTKNGNCDGVEAMNGLGIEAMIYIALIRKESEKGYQASYKMVYPKSNTPLVLNNVFDTDKVSFMYMTKDDKFSLNSRRCGYTAPTGDVVISGFGVCDPAFNTIEPDRVTVVSNLISDIQKSKNPYVKIYGNKIEVTAEVWSGEGADRVIMARGKVLLELQK